MGAFWLSMFLPAVDSPDSFKAFHPWRVKKQLCTQQTLAAKLLRVPGPPALPWRLSKAIILSVQTHGSFTLSAFILRSSISHWDWAWAAGAYLPFSSTVTPSALGTPCPTCSPHLLFLFALVTQRNPCFQLVASSIPLVPQSPGISIFLEPSVHWSKQLFLLKFYFP